MLIDLGRGKLIPSPTQLKSGRAQWGKGQINTKNKKCEPQ